MIVNQNMVREFGIYVRLTGFFLRNIALSNNIAKRSIWPITLGSKNWYFSISETGA